MPTTLADIRSRVLRVIKRKDIPVADLNEWISDAVRRIQRTLRTPMDEALSRAIVPTTGAKAINVPGNLVNLLSIQVDGVELKMRSVTEIKALQDQPASQPLYYTREASTYLIAPVPRPGAVVTILYRADQNALSQDTDTMKLFDIAGDLVMYGALIRGADWSIDDRRLTTWNNIYNTLFVELQDMADRDELLNASIAPAYNSNGDWY